MVYCSYAIYGLLLNIRTEDQSTTLSSSSPIVLVLIVAIPTDSAAACVTDSAHDECH